MGMREILGTFENQGPTIVSAMGEQMNRAAEFDNAGWQRELRKKQKLKQCQFPEKTEIKIDGSREQATITMTRKGLLRNMQMDAAAFEAWALTLLGPLEVKCIRIGLDSGAARADRRHYQRYLYRLERFCELFTEGRVIASPEIEKATALNPNVTCVLNRPNRRPKTPDNEAELRFRAVLDSNPRKISESVIEKALEVSYAFKNHFGLDKVMRHWPVGLFEGSVRTENHIFPGGSSAIDLIGIRDDTLMVFELKTGENRKVGGVSELFFYANVMRDAIRPVLKFKFESEDKIENCAISARSC
jgi:hypothetical protein